MSTLISKLFHYVLLTCTKYGIDESHGVSHSMNVLHYADKLYEAERIRYPFIKEHKRIIYTSAILHDMCDKKYMDEEEGAKQIAEYLSDTLSKEEIDISTKIMTTMSYSTVKRKGFPNLGEYQMAYHIVRESDLLTAYDFDRSMIYNIHKSGSDIKGAFENAKDLFETRVFRHRVDGLILLDSSRVESIRLHNLAVRRMEIWKKMIH